MDPGLASSRIAVCRKRRYRNEGPFEHLARYENRAVGLQSRFEMRMRRLLDSLRCAMKPLTAAASPALAEPLGIDRLC